MSECSRLLYLDFTLVIGSRSVDDCLTVYRYILMSKMLSLLCLVNLLCLPVFADQHRVPVRSEVPAKRSQDFKADYELLNEKLMDLLSAAKYDELEWKEVNGMQVLADNDGPATFKVPGRDAVAFVMLLDPSQAASNSTCSAGNVIGYSKPAVLEFSA